MNKAWIHIFDKGACLTRRQIKDYISGTMANEECHALEVHLNGCVYCSEAMEGLSAEKGMNRVDAMVALDRGFLTERFGISHPEIHLNSIAPAAAASPAGRRRGRLKAKPLTGTPAILLLLVLGIGVLWYTNRNKMQTSQVAPAGTSEVTIANEKGRNTDKPASSAKNEENLEAIHTAIATTEPKTPANKKQQKVEAVIPATVSKTVQSSVNAKATPMPAQVETEKVIKDAGRDEAKQLATATPDSHKKDVQTTEAKQQEIIGPQEDLSLHE